MRSVMVAVEEMELMEQGPQGNVVRREGELWYEVEGVERLRRFMMMLTSDRDHWLFINSDGTLTCGRRNPDHAILPYYTVDKLGDMGGSSGSYSGVRRVGAEGLWEPYAAGALTGSAVVRRLRKSQLGNTIELEETHADWGLRCTVSYRTSEGYGIVRTVTVENIGERAIEIELLDGMRNLLCPGLDTRFQNEFSCLGDAYKTGELTGGGRLGLYALSSIPTDLAEPMEALRANVALGLGELGAVTVDAEAVDVFRRGEPVEPCSVLRGQRPAYLRHIRMNLAAGEQRRLMLCLDVDYDLIQVEALLKELEAGACGVEQVDADCMRGSARLREMLMQGDGWQLTRDLKGRMRHLSNTTFNLMRGGALPTGYQFPEGDLVRTAAAFNREAARALEEFTMRHGELNVQAVWAKGGELDADARRLAREYLPLTFSRRHGDPSRPWNRFSIELEDADGNPRFAYQGNWRDIFQNWEALLQGYPLYLRAAINRFLNASSADGYNPYRLTKEGFEWEEPNPEDPWANIGYWGDHQIIYLLRLLESAERYHPQWWREQLAAGEYVYADIPYRILEYANMVANPRSTIEFDEARSKRIATRVTEIGSDGKLLFAGDQPVRVGLLEKLLVPMLAKLANFVPYGGIWMNTQRPEWNDANNALVGYGVSVVTAGYLHRYAAFLLEQFGEVLENGSFELSSPVAQWLNKQVDWFSSNPAENSDTARADCMRIQASAADAYRSCLYAGEFSSAKEAVSGARIVEWIRVAKLHLEATLVGNRRTDGLYHAYNLLKFTDDGVEIKRLGLMLEGQVSIMSSGVLSPRESLELYRALRRSDLYRQDQDSYLLYPDRKLAGFREKNRVSADKLARFPALRPLVEQGAFPLLRAAPDGDFLSFHPDLRNSGDLRKRLSSTSCRALPEHEVEALIELYEDTFQHHAFTGRSGTFFAYEGLGSIYWHMVSKLGLAVLEAAVSVETSGDEPLFLDLLDAYESIKSGLGVDKPVKLHGAIPTDAYSHTPGHAGAQQPGMTGQVKEDMLARQLELGVRIHHGCISFTDSTLRREREELVIPEAMEFIHVDGSRERLTLQPGSFGFAICQVPVVYRHPVGGASGIEIRYADGRCVEVDSLSLPPAVCSEIFGRTNMVRRITVSFCE